MSSSRIVRGTKARIFLYVCAVLIITAILACYNNTLSQLDDARKSSEICHQQEENLSTQLQVISDYKQRLEKSLKTEKAEHQQSKNDLENKLKEEKTKYEKDTSEANLRFSSLQQHFNLLKTQHGDFKDECSKTQKKQLVEINDIQAKLKEVQEELKKVISSKEGLKTEYLQLQIDKEALQKELKNNIDNKGDNESKFNNLEKVNHELQRELNDLKEKCSTLEVIPGQLPLSSSTSSSNKQLGADEYALKSPDQDRQQQEAPQFEKSSISNTSNINVIKIPSKSTTSSSFKVSQANLDGALPLIIPTVTPKSEKINKASLALPLPYVKLPEGVVPVPPKHETEQKNADEEKNELENSETVNNRYRNKIETPKEDVKKNEENDNVGNEVFDNPGAHHAGYDHLGFGDVNVMDPIKNAEKQQVNKQHIDNLAVGDKVLKHYDNDYRGDNQNDLQIEDNDPEDDDPDYGAEQLGRLKDAIVRN